MSQFNFQEYQDIVKKAQSGSTNNAPVAKVGFFKLKNDMDEALVRFNVHSTDDLSFATVHQLGAANKYMKVSCLAPLGSSGKTATCPLCALAENDPSIGKAAKRVFVQAMVAYKDPATEGFSAAIPVIWERPAGFAREIAGYLNNYGDLTEHVFKITRNGVAGARDTSYSINYIPIFDKEELIAKDFSAFANFDIAKHSYWVKTAAEIAEFIETGKFPVPTRTTGKSAAQAAASGRDTIIPAAAPQPIVAPVVEQAAPAGIETTVSAPAWVNPVPIGGVAPAPVKQEEPAHAISTDRPARKFGDFKF